MIKIYNEDCLVVLKTLPDNSVDSVVTDPPYGLVSIQKRFGKEGAAPAKYGDDGSFSRLSKGFMGKSWDGSGIEYSVELWSEVLRVLKPGGYLLSFGGTRTYHRMACAIEDAGFEIRDMVEWIYGSGFPKSLNIGEGWGTALKPAHEPICMARKPLAEKTVAENVLKYDTGGINIDGCRVAHDEPEKLTNRTPRTDDNVFSDNSCGFKKEVNHIASASLQGRFPANLIHDGSDEVVREFPQSTSGAMTKPYKYTNNGYSLGKPTGETKQIHESSQGSAARFFYCAKASKSERNNGCEEFEEKKRDEGRKEGNPGGDNPRNRGVKPQHNNHPTVKPIALMRYLCRMVTPKGGIVLDPFMGSGTTGIAAKLEGFGFIGIEKEKEYCEIAEARIAAWEEEKEVADTQGRLFE